jgi:large subunit ribosomal protein L9
MELILLHSVEGLGRPGDQVKVKPGFARNYLLPKGIAVPVSAEAMRSLDKLRARADAEERALLSSMEELAKAIEGAEVRIESRATEERHLFGSVNEKDIHSALVAAGWKIPPRSVRLETNLKESGVAEVELHLYGTVTATVKVDVVPVDAEGRVIEEPSEDEAADTSLESAAAASGERGFRVPEVPDEASNR